jgi:glycosyltransferase involved in cell wall biosynthesis
MRVLVLSNYFPPKFVGGAETYAYQMGVELVKKGFRVDVITSRSLGENPVEDEMDGIRVHRIVPRIFTNIIKPNNPFSLYCFNSLFNPLSYRLLPLIKKIDPDIIHLHMINLFDIIALTRSLVKPTVWTIHDYWPICPLGSLYNFKKDQPCMKDCARCIYPPLLQGSSKFQLSRRARALSELEKKISLFIVPSNFMRKKLLEFNYVKEDKVRVIRNGINIDEFPYTSIEPTKNILFVGKLCREKGCEHLVKAMPQILSHVPDAKLLIVGPGTEKEKQMLLSLVRELKIEGNVEFLGKIPNVSSYYQKANVIVLPSITFENCSLVILESLASGRPVIASALGGTPELIEDGKTGFLLEPRNPYQISEKVVRVLLDDDLAKKMGKAAREKAEKELSMRAHIEKLESVYQQIISNPCFEKRGEI